MDLVEIRKEFDTTSAAVGAGGVAGALAVGAPFPRSPMTNRGRGVKRKLEKRARIPGGRTRLSAADFAEVSGGRGYRPKNDQYTARLARAMKTGDKRAKQNRLVLDIYDNNIVQRDGAHRAEAAAMLGRKIKVKAVRHRGEKAPLHMTGINAIRDEIVQGRQRNRLKTYGRSGGLSPFELERRAGGAKAPSKAVELLGGSMSRASGSGLPKGGIKGVSPAGVAAGAGILGGTALLTAKGGRRKQS